jgi:hypothetical protein
MHAELGAGARAIHSQRMITVVRRDGGPSNRRPAWRCRGLADNGHGLVASTGTPRGPYWAAASDPSTGKRALYICRDPMFCFAIEGTRDTSMRAIELNLLLSLALTWASSSSYAQSPSECAAISAAADRFHAERDQEFAARHSQHSTEDLCPRWKKMITELNTMLTLQRANLPTGRCKSDAETISKIESGIALYQQRSQGCSF